MQKFCDNRSSTTVAVAKFDIVIFIRTVFLRLSFMQLIFHNVELLLQIRSIHKATQYLKCYKQNPLRTKICLNFLHYVYVFNNKDKYIFECF